MKGFIPCYKTVQQYKFVFFIITCFICTSFVALSQPNLNSTLPALTLFYNQNTKTLKTQTLNDKYVLYYVWSAKFPSIITHIDNLKTLYKQYKNTTFANNAKGLEIVFISIDRNAEEWQQACLQLGIDFEYNSSNFKNGNFEAYKLFGFPRKPVLCLVEPFTQKVIGTDNTFAELDAMLRANETSTNFAQTDNSNAYEVFVGNFVTTFRQPPISNLPATLLPVSNKTLPVADQPNTVALTVGNFTSFEQAQQFLESVLQAGFKDAQLLSVNNFDETLVRNNLKLRTQFETPSYIPPPPSQIQYDPALNNYGVPILINKHNTNYIPTPPTESVLITSTSNLPVDYNSNNNNSSNAVSPPYPTSSETITTSTFIFKNDTTKIRRDNQQNTPNESQLITTTPILMGKNDVLSSFPPPTPPAVPPPTAVVDTPQQQQQQQVQTEYNKSPNVEDPFNLYGELTRKEKRKMKKLEKLKEKTLKLESEIKRKK